MKKILLILVGFFVLCISLCAQTRRDGELLFNEGRYEEAYDVYASLASSYPKDYLLKYQMGRCLFELNRYDEAVGLFESALRKDIKKANIYLGEIYFSQYRFEESVAAYSAYIETLGEGEDSLLMVYQTKIMKSNLGASMLERVEDIAVIDSVKIDKQHFLFAYRLPRDLGKLGLYRDEDGVSTEEVRGVYYTGREDKMLFANGVDGGDLDLNVSYRLVGGWSDAVGLSSVLNTSEDENFPFELPDGVTLYFASKGHNSLGGYDIFLTRYNGTINDYSVPVNIGMPFNSPANDYLYVFDELAHIGWFATDRCQHADTVVVYEFVPNAERVLLRTDDVDYRRRVAQMKAYRKANLTAEEGEDNTIEIGKQESEISFFVNDGVVYTRVSQFRSEVARGLFVELQEADKRLLTLMRLLEGKRREFFFAVVEDDRDVLRAEVLELEAKVRRYKELVDEYVLQIRREEILIRNKE